LPPTATGRFQKMALLFGTDPVRQSDAKRFGWTSAQPRQHLHRESAPQQRRQRQRGLGDDIV
jgi:hypothetical protein